jgi:hypothetical protein
MTYDLLILVVFALIGIGGFLIGYGWAAFLENWTDGR